MLRLYLHSGTIYSWHDALLVSKVFKVRYIIMHCTVRIAKLFFTWIYRCPRIHIILYNPLLVSSCYNFKNTANRFEGFQTERRHYISFPLSMTSIQTTSLVVLSRPCITLLYYHSKALLVIQKTDNSYS